MIIKEVLTKKKGLAINEWEQILEGSSSLLSRNYNGLVTSCLHAHNGGALFDSVDVIKKYPAAAKKAGYKKLAESDHGSFTAMQSLIDATAKDPDIDMIYGLEAYVEVPGFSMQEKVAHLIMYACDIEGKHIIDKLNSKAAGTHMGNPVITWEQLKSVNFDGHVIATTACISGAPALQILINDILDSKISKLEKAIAENALLPIDEAKYMSEKNPAFIEAKKDLEKVDADLVALVAKRDDKTRLSEITKLLRDAVKSGNTAEQAKLEKEKADIEAEKEQIKEKIKTTRNVLRKAANAKFTAYKDKVDAYANVLAEIESYKSRKVDDETRLTNAEKVICDYMEIFGKENFFVEVQYHGMEAEEMVYTALAKIAKKIGIGIVAANDSHMPDDTQRSLNVRNVARFLRFGRVDERPWDAEMYIKTPNELAAALLCIFDKDTIDEAMMNVNVIGDRCNYVPEKKAHYPVYDKTQDSNELLRKIAYDNIEWRYPNRVGWDNAHQERLDYELGIIIQMGFADYFLIVKDFLEYGRICGLVPTDKLSEVPFTIEGAKKYVAEHNYKAGMGIGVGRGSGAGSLVTYNLGITNVDPFKYDLVFERFLNPERVSMPDIDSDLSVDVRVKVIEYVRYKYGTDAVVGIITENREGVKGAIRDAGRYLGAKRFAGQEDDPDKHYLALCNRMRKSVPEQVGLGFNTEVEDGVTCYDFLRKEYATNAEALEILEIAKDLEGMLTSYGQHAAGVIIYDGEDITDYISVRKSKLGGYVTEMDMIQAEANKLLKMDFLGLKNLSILTDTVRMIENSTGKVINIETDIPLDDENVYKEIYAKGRTTNVFQFESGGMKKYLKELFA